MDELREARAVLDVAHNAFVSMNEAGVIVYWNLKAEEIFDLPRSEAVGRTVADTIVPERYREAHWNGLGKLLSTGRGAVLNKRLELAGLRSDGTEFPIEMTISALREGASWSFHAFISDISARKASEAERQRLLEELRHTLHGTEQRLSVIVNALAEAVTIRGPDNHLTYANQAALDLLGFDSVDALRQADPRALLGSYEVTDEHGNPIELDDLPSVKLVRGEDPEPLLVRGVDLDSGRERWTLLKSAAIHDPSGSVAAAVTIIEDVTTVKRSALMLEFLARAGQVLGSSLDYEQTLHDVANLAVPQIADWCGLYLFDEQSPAHPVVIAHAHTVSAATPSASAPTPTPPLEKLPSSLGLDAVRSTGNPLLLPTDDARSELLSRAGLRSALIVPMRVRGRTIGALTLMNSASRQRFSHSDLDLVGRIAERAALAVENARLYAERSEVALTLQRSLLPDALPDIPGWELATLYQAAGAGNEVGGDFYDFWKARDGWMMMIGDVTGKGPAAAAITSLVRHTARAVSEFDPSPAGILERVNTALRERPSLEICTALCMRLGDSQVRIAAGGHPLPLCLSDDGIREVGVHGTLLGAFPQVNGQEVTLALHLNDTLVAFTDGVIDAVGPGGARFGESRLRRALAGGNHAPDAIRTALSSALAGFQSDPQTDDITVVAMRCSGSAPAPIPQRS